MVKRVTFLGQEHEWEGQIAARLGIIAPLLIMSKWTIYVDLRQIR